MQACEGYVENGQFYPVGLVVQTPVRLRAFLTILDEPAKTSKTKACKQFWAEFDRLAAASANEELREENFPKMTLRREPVTIFDEA